MDKDTTYQVIRFFEDGDSEVIARGLTLEEAKAHCNDPETSSRTCTSEKGHQLTRERGRWFDGFDQD